MYAAPGNPGIARMVETLPVAAEDPSEVADLARRLGVDLVVIGPEAPLVAGVADAVRAAGIACFGPSAQAARIEGSKAFAKHVMAAAGVPTAGSVAFSRLEAGAAGLAEVGRALDSYGPPYVVKADGLAAGKGVLVTADREQALAHAMDAGSVVVEEFLDGPEVSLFAITDGSTVLPLLPAQDFKRLGDGDTGPNTGGMGAYAPLEWVPTGFTDEVLATVLQPTVHELGRRGTPFRGLLYAGLAVTSQGVRVVEFNARFGDPETQALLPLLRTGLSAPLYAAATGDLDTVGPLDWSDDTAVTVVLAAAGYPDAPSKGDPIIGVQAAERLPGVHVDHAGTADRRGAVAGSRAGDVADPDGNGGDDGLVTAGGRVLAVTAVAPDLAVARERAYQGVAAIELPGGQHRRDIAVPPAVEAP